jgi:23S rRNA pseudouridine2605 synthase
MEERIQKILSKCGIASRRKAEEMILEGLVKVNGVKATLGMKADINRDHIKVGRKLIGMPQKKVYLMFNKPANCLTSSDESEPRPTVKDYLKRLKTPVFPVGRLDYNSEGLLLLTNDGDFANAILHPKSKIPKTYRVKIDGMLDDKSLGQLEQGIRLEDGMTAPARVRTVTKLAANSWIDITIHEGKKRQVRRMLQRVGNPVIKLKRIRINGLPLGNLKPGEYRHLTGVELEKLKAETVKTT